MRRKGCRSCVDTVMLAVAPRMPGDTDGLHWIKSLEAFEWSKTRCKMMLCGHVHENVELLWAGHVMKVSEAFYPLQFQRPSWDLWPAFNLRVIITKGCPKGLPKRGQAADATSSLSLSERIFVSSPQSAKMKTKRWTDGQMTLTSHGKCNAKCWMSSGPELKEVIGRVMRFCNPQWVEETMRFVSPMLEIYAHSQVLVLAVLPELSFLLPCKICPTPTFWERCYYRGVERWVILRMQSGPASLPMQNEFTFPNQHTCTVYYMCVYTSNLDIWIHVTYVENPWWLRNLLITNYPISNIPDYHPIWRHSFSVKITNSPPLSKRPDKRCERSCEMCTTPVVGAPSLVTDSTVSITRQSDL